MYLIWVFNSTVEGTPHKRVVAGSSPARPTSSQEHCSEANKIRKAGKHMEEKKKYVCPLCGTEYDTPKAMAHCVLECEEKQRAERERLRQEQLDQEKDKRWDEVVAAGERYKELFYQFFNDYQGGTWRVGTPWKVGTPISKFLWGF